MAVKGKLERELGLTQKRGNGGKMLNPKGRQCFTRATSQEKAGKGPQCRAPGLATAERPGSDLLGPGAMLTGTTGRRCTHIPFSCTMKGCVFIFLN